MSILAQMVIAISLLVAGFGAGVKWHAGQDAIKENARLELVREQARASRALEQQQSKQVIGAINAARKRETVARSAAADARSELERLRDDLAAIRPNLSSDSLDACRKRADTLAAVFGECSATLEGMAGKADRHASDTLTLEQAWPTQPPSP